MNSIRVLIVEDNLKFRYLIGEILSLEKDITICGEAKNFEEAKSFLLAGQADVTLLDISIGDPANGFEFLKEMIHLKIPSRFIMLSAYSENIYSDKCLKAGADGYVCKDKAVPCLAAAIRSVLSGKKFVSSEV